MDEFPKEGTDHKMLENIPQLPEPIIIGPLRFYEPYNYVFTSRAKGRWVGKTVIDAFLLEFKENTIDSLKEKIKNGSITINDKLATPDYIIARDDVIKNAVLRKESPSLNVDATIIDENDDFIAYFKPSSLPVHACGGYYYNTLVKRVKPGHLPTHRLDRVTSGIIVYSKSSEAANRFRINLGEEKCKKIYVARVLGEFPEEEIVVDQPICEVAGSRAKRTVGPNGKPSKTIFKRIKTNGKESIVECRPLTGRTHQIRVHLAYAGYPISNDSFYGGIYFLTDEEIEALNKAKERDLISKETMREWDEKEILFSIFLCSVRYESDIFSFKIEHPEWCDLDRFILEKPKDFIPEKLLPPKE